MDVKEFAVGLMSHWWALMGGASFTLLGFLLPLWTKLNKRTNVFSFVLALFFVVVACYQTWHDQHVKWLEEYAKTHPGLHLSIVDTVGFGTRKDGGTVVFIQASISNLGAPSIADNWTLEATLPGGQKIVKRPSVIHQDQPIDFTYADGSRQIRDPKDALYVKAMSQPIATGDKKIGYLMFDFASTRLPRGTIMFLKCEDVAGNEITSNEYLRAEKSPNGIPYLPGTTLP